MKSNLQYAVVLLGFVFLAGCHHYKSAAEDAPLVVSAAHLNPARAVGYEEFTGRTAAINRLSKPFLNKSPRISLTHGRRNQRIRIHQTKNLV